MYRFVNNGLPVLCMMNIKIPTANTYKNAMIKKPKYLLSNTEFKKSESTNDPKMITINSKVEIKKIDEISPIRLANLSDCLIPKSFK